MKTPYVALAFLPFAAASVACGGSPEGTPLESTASTQEALNLSFKSPMLPSPTPAPTSTTNLRIGNIALPPTPTCGDDGESCCQTTIYINSFPKVVNACNPGNDCKSPSNRCVKQPPPPPCGGIGELCCNTAEVCRPISNTQATACLPERYDDPVKYPGKCVECGNLWQPSCDPGSLTGCAHGNVNHFGTCVPAAINLPVPPSHSVPDAKSGFDARARAFLEHEACGNNDLRYPDPNSDPDPEHWGTTALAMAAFDGKCRTILGEETQAQRLAIVDHALANFDLHDRLLGSTIKMPSRKGELDAWLKDLVPLLYLYGSRLSPATYNKILDQFGQIDSGWDTDAYNSLHIDNNLTMSFLESVIPIPFLPLLDNVIEVEIPETENHLLLIYTARYLVNQLRQHRQDVGPVGLVNMPFAFDNKINGMRDHMLREMQRILQHDFQEYNAHPYNRYALDAVENLAEFAEDPDVATAARAVLDFEAAKYAISSSFSRRVAPFRRRRDLDSSLLIGDSMDEEACRFTLYAGTTDLMQNPSDATYPVTVPQACHLVARQAAGSYRVPELILQMAIEPQVRPTFQTFAGGTNPFHDAPGGVELTANDHHFMISSGGIALPSGLGVTVHLRIGSNPFIPTGNEGDLGIAVPTVLVPTTPYPPDDPRNGFDRNEMVHLGGDGMINTCVAPGFACGFQPVVPPTLCNKKEIAHDDSCLDGHWAFLDFQGFFVAVWRDDTQTAGFFEAVEASHFVDFDTFRKTVKQSNGDGGGVLTMNGGTPVLDVNYVNSLGQRIIAHLDAGAVRTYPIQSYFGQKLPPSDVDTWPLAKDYDGWSSLASRGHDGVVTVAALGLGQCTLDLSDLQHPQRVGNCN